MPLDDDDTGRQQGNVPTFVTADTDSVPTGVWSVVHQCKTLARLMTTVQDAVSKFTEALNVVMKLCHLL